MEKTNQPGVYLRGGVGLPTVAPRSTSKVRQSVEKASNSSSSPIGVAFNQNINKSSPDKDNFRFKRQISGSSNDMAVSVEDEFSRKDSFRFPSGGNITNVTTVICHKHVLVIVIENHVQKRNKYLFKFLQLDV